MNPESPTRLTRQQACEYLNRGGYPIKPRYFEKLACAGSGPRVDGFFGARAMYLPEDLIEWAESRYRPADPKAA
jgi:hypothetical protein